MTYSNWHGLLCNGLLPPWSWSAAPSVDILSAQEQWIGKKNPFIYIQMICTSQCFLYIWCISMCEHTFKISLVVPKLCIQPSISYHTWLRSLACLVMTVYGAIGTWIMFFLGDEDSHSILDGSVAPMLAIIQMLLYPVSPSGLVYCVLASTIPHVYIRPRCPLNFIPLPYLSYNNCPLLLLLAPLAIPCPLPQTPQNNSTTSTTF